MNRATSLMIEFGIAIVVSTAIVLASDQGWPFAVVMGLVAGGLVEGLLRWRRSERDWA